MVKPIASGEETKRIQTLHSLKMLDAQPHARFERVTRLAKRLFDVPVAILHFTDQSENSRYAEVLEVFDLARAASERTSSEREIFLVADTHEDPRFDDDAVMLDDREIRFYAGCPVHSPDGCRLGTLCLLDTAPRVLSGEDIELFNELRDMVNEELSSLSMATSEDLTKLANRRGFERIASHILPMAARLGLTLALVQIDLDDFKQINDTQGHDAGDRMLVGFARHLLKNFRESDVVARLGGDEFCVLMSGAAEAEVRRSLRRLKTLLDQHTAECVRFSAGVATFDAQRHAGIEDLLREADRRMYETKRRKGTGAPRCDPPASFG